MADFATLPADATMTPSPFKIAIPDEQIEEMRTLIRLSKSAPPTYEGSQKDTRFGVTNEWLDNTKQKWLSDFDWRACEAKLNQFPQFTTEIEGLRIHFVALFSQKKDAVPIVFLHGWPGSFLEFIPILSRFREKYSPDDLPYNLIVPSLPGFAFSSGPPVDRNFVAADAARIVNTLLVDLGFGGGYVAQGGDIGSILSRILAADHEACKAVHLNFLPLPQKASEAEMAADPFLKNAVERANWFATYGRGYSLEHGTKPSTIGSVLASNPVAVLAWIGEKFLEWVDDRDPLPLETILESITLYWLTETFPRSIYFYRQAVPPPAVPTPLQTRFHIKKPLGYSSFPRELSPMIQSWIPKTDNLVYYNQHDRGGHFAALERPQELADDVVAFVQQVWPAASKTS